MKKAKIVHRFDWHGAFLFVSLLGREISLLITFSMSLMWFTSVAFCPMCYITQTTPYTLLVIPYNLFGKFHVLLTVRPGMILVNNQLDAHFFMYVYFYSLNVSGSHVPIIRRIVVSMRHLVYVILKQVNSLKLQTFMV